MTINKLYGNQLLVGGASMPKYFESKKRESLRLPWWIPLLLLLAAAIVVGILLANIFPDALRAHGGILSALPNKPRRNSKMELEGGRFENIL